MIRSLNIPLSRGITILIKEEVGLVPSSFLDTLLTSSPESRGRKGHLWVREARLREGERGIRAGYE